MAEKQGSAAVYKRRSKILLAPTDLVGARQDEDGLWEGAGFLVALRHAHILLSEADPCTRAGAAIRDVLQRSNVVAPGQHLFDKTFDSELAKAFGLKTEKALYADMLSCSVEWRGDSVIYMPSRRRRGGGFEGFRQGFGHEDIEIAFSALDEQLGQAMHECLRRCL